MIQEKQMAAAMKRAYSGSGYEVFGFTVDGTDKFYIAKPTEWAALLPRKLTGRKVLALLAEHLGEIPDGTAWTVSKTRGAQMTEPGMMTGSIEKLRTMCAGGAVIEPTMLEYNGTRIWQCSGGEPVLIPHYSDMAPEDIEAKYVPGCAVTWNDGNCLLMVAEDAAELPEELRNALSGIEIPKQ